MFELTPWRKLGELAPFGRVLRAFRGTMDRMFGRFFDKWPFAPSRDGAWAPTVDLSETAEHIAVRAEVPGISPNDIQISLVGDTLTIKGEKKQEKDETDENYHYTERSHGSFSRSISLPCDIQEDKVDATYKDGVLTIKMPKCTPSAAKEIKINVKS